MPTPGMPCTPSRRLRSPFLAWTWQREWVAVFARGPAAGAPPRRGRRRPAGRAAAALRDRSPAAGCSPAAADVSDYLDLIAAPRPRGRGVGRAARRPRRRPRRVGAARRAGGLADRHRAAGAGRRGRARGAAPRSRSDVPSWRCPPSWDALPRLALRQAPSRAQPQAPPLRARGARGARVTWASTPAGIEAPPRRLPGPAPPLARGQGQVHGRAHGAVLPPRRRGARRRRAARAWPSSTCPTAPSPRS